MAERKSQSAYQYEPLVTPSNWNGEERRFSIRLSQLLDDLFRKQGAASQRLKAIEQKIDSSPEEPEVPSTPSFTLADVYPVGSVYVSAENVNPADVFGGTWELFDKEFMPQTISGEDIFAINTTNVSILDNAYCTLAGHNIHFRIRIRNKVSLSDNTLPMGTVNFANIGVTGLPINVVGYGASDGLQGPLYYTLDKGTGLLEHADLQGEGATTTGQTIYYTVEQPIPPEQMLDSFCNKFYWKRTA